MSPFEYILPLVSVIVGLAITDVAVSIHRLLRNRRRVEWDWLALAAALLAVVAVLNLWWGFYSVQASDFYTAFGGFLPLAAQLLLLFLLSAAALPDGVPDEGVDLRQFYRENHGQFWVLFAAYVTAIIVQNLVGVFASAGTVSAAFVVERFGPRVALLVACLILAKVESRRVHAVLVPLLLLALVFLSFRMRLSLA